MAYFLGRGCVYMGDYDTDGKFKKVTEFHCPEFAVDVSETEFVDHDNTCDPIGTRDLHVPTKITPKLEFKIDTDDPELLAIALGGENTETASGASFSAKLFPTVAVGDILPVPGGYSNLESLTLTDSAGSPATLSAGTHYTVDLTKGLVTFLNLGSFTQPFKAAGAENDAFNAISIGTDASVEKFIRFAGVNIANEDEAFTFDAWRVSIDPSKYMPKSSGNEVFTFEFSGMLMRDSNAPFSGAFGKYGRLLKT